MIKSFTAYNIDGEYYLHSGKPNGKTKKKIQRCIQENKEAIERGETQTTIDCYSFVNGWEEAKTSNTWDQNKNQPKEKITDKKRKNQWLQLTLEI